MKVEFRVKGKGRYDLRGICMYVYDGEVGDRKISFSMHGLHGLQY